MSASNPFNGRRGRRSGSTARDTRSAARELLAWLEHADDRDAHEEHDWDDTPPPSKRKADDERRTRTTSARSLNAILERLEEAEHAEADQSQDQLATILEKFEQRIQAAEENAERARLQARKERAENAIASRMSSSLDAMKDRLEILQENAYRNDTSPKTHTTPEASEAQAALRAQLAKLEQRFSGIARARTEAETTTPQAVDITPKQQNNFNPAEQALSQIEQRIERLSETLNAAINRPAPAMQPAAVSQHTVPARPRIQPPPAVNANHYAHNPSQWPHENVAYPEFHQPGAVQPAYQPQPAAQAAVPFAHSIPDRRVHAPQQPALDLSPLQDMGQTLSDMERRLRALDPGSAVAGITHELQGLRERLDALAGHEPDMSSLEDVRAGTLEIRNALSRLPSTELFAKLARDVQLITGKLDQVAHATAQHTHSAPALAPLLNNAIGGIHDSLGHFSKQIDKRIEGLTEKQQGFLENAVGNLNASVKQFDTSIHAISTKIDERIGAIADNNTTPLRLNAIEHNLAGLFRKMEEQRAEAQAFNRQRDEEAALNLDRHMQELGKQLDYTRRNVAEITAASADHLVRSTAHTLDSKTEALKQHTETALDSMTSRLAALTEKAVERTSGKATEGVERASLATTSALEKIAANTTRQISTLEIAVREIGSRLDRIKHESPAPAAIDHLRSDVQELSKYMGRMPFSAVTQPNISHIQSSINELLGRVESLSPSRSYDNASEILRNAVSDIAAQVVQSVREQLNDSSITVRAQLNDTSFNALQRSLDNLGERIEQRSDTHNSRLLDAVQKSINSLGIRLDQVARSAPEPVALNTIQNAIENLAAKLEHAEKTGHFNASDTINKAVNELAERLKHTNTQLGSISSLENGLNTLLAQMSATQSSTLQASEAVAAKVVRDVLANQPQAAAPQQGRVNELAQTMAELKADAARSEQRTNDQLNAVKALVEKFVTQPTMPFVTPAAANAHPVEQPAEAETSPAELARAAARKAMMEAREAGHVAPVVNVTTPAFTPEVQVPSVEIAPLSAQTAPTPAVPVDNAHKMAFQNIENTINFHPNLRETHEEPEDILDLVNEHVNTRSRFIAAARRSLNHGHPMETASLAAVEAALDPANTNEEDKSFTQDAFKRAKQFAEQGFATPARRKSMMIGLAASLLLLGSYQVAQHALNGATFDTQETASLPQSDTLASLQDKAVRMVETAPVFPDARESATSSVTKNEALQSAQADNSDSLITGSIPNLEPMAIPEPLPPAIGSPRLRTRAFAGDAAAQYEVGTRYTEGRGVGRNLKAAAAWYERAARQGSAPAQYRLASMFEKGSGIDKNLQQAKYWYEKAATAGNARAMHNLGVLHAEGGLGSPDFQKAAEWFYQGASHGIKDSQFNYAILLVRGLGVKQNLAESYLWLALVAEQGDRDAASKRDQLAEKLDPRTLAQAKERVKNWQAAPLKTEANEVEAPSGGWDDSLASSSRSNPVRR